MATQKPKRRVKETTKIGGWTLNRTITTKKSGAKTVRDKSTDVGKESARSKSKKTLSPGGKRKSSKSRSVVTTPTTKAVYKVKKKEGKKKVTKVTKINKATGRRTKTVERHGRRKK